MFKILVKNLGKYRPAAAAAPVFTTAETVTEMFIPFVTAMIIDRGINAGDTGNVLFYGGIMLALALICLTFGMVSTGMGTYASTGLAYNLRDSVFSHIQKFSFSNIDKFSASGLITRMTTDITNVQNAFHMALRMVVRAPVTLISSMVMCFVINAGLSLVFLAVMVFLSLVMAFITLKTYPMFQQVFRKYEDLNSDVRENIAAIRVVKSFVREEHEISKFKKAVEGVYRLFVKVELYMAFMSPALNLTVYSCIIALSWFGALNITAGNMTTGNLTSMLSYAMSMMMALMMLNMIFVMVTMSMASLKRISEVLAEEPDMAEPDDPAGEVADGSVDFENVSFSYKTSSGDAALRNVSFHIDSGLTAGIIGGTGSGKSSLVNLISRLYDATEGSVKVGGRDVREYSTSVLRDCVSVVLQNNVLFSGTVLDNLRWGNEAASEEECVRACVQACAHEFIIKMPDGYKTRIERGGTNVSGGQKQRLCIARALLKNPKVLILDDSTSAVDTATDARIRAALSDALPGTTKIIIAQRISSIKDADIIIVLWEGGISGMGTHEELLKTNRIYREIVEAQMESGGDFDE